MRTPKGFWFFESLTATLGICKGQPFVGTGRFSGLFEKVEPPCAWAKKDFSNFKWDGSCKIK